MPTRRTQPTMPIHRYAARLFSHALAHTCAAVMLLTLSGCGGGASSSSSDSTSSNPNNSSANTDTNTSTATQLSVAQLLFEDKSLSASNQQSCASCHTDTTAHADPAGTTLPLGGTDLKQQGTRSSPSLLYLESNTAFQFVNGKPMGGFAWDGRANTRAEQAAGPLLSNAEMANSDTAAVAAKVRALSYFSDFSRVFSLPAQASDTQVYDTLRTALQTYQQIDPDYLLFNSKFDNVLSGTATLSTVEARGLAIFNDPTKGNCASCHTSAVGTQGERPLFTDFSYAALGLPRNAAITANSDPTFFDMGLCGPKRTDLSHRTDLCGMFKVPTLRNIALTAPYFHNASVSDLTTAVGFYATRDIDPARWYTVNGVVTKFNDLPAAYRGNVIQTAPFGLAAGATPRLSRQDVADIVAFLLTLTDDRSAPANKATVR